MLGSIRNALVAALIAAVGTLGVSYAATGSFNPGKLVTEGSTPRGPDLAAGASDVTPTEDGSSDVTPTQGHGPERSEVGCGDFSGEDGKFNHGQFVRQSPKGGEARRAAAHSDCGKPVQATEHGDDDEAEAADTPDAENEREAKPEKQGRGHSENGGPGNSDFGHSQGNSENKSRGNSGK